MGQPRSYLKDMDQRVIIVGGGLNGCMLALALAHGGIKCSLIDAQSPDALRRNDFDGRSYALASASQKMLDVLGVWSKISDSAQPMLDIKVTDGRVGQGPSPFFMEFDHQDLGQGPLGYLVEDRHIRRALLDQIVDLDIDHKTSVAVVDQSVDAHGVTATLSDGSQITGALLVGADGRASGTAKRAGIKRTGWSYDQASLVCAVEHQLPHDGVAHQFFLPSGPLAILPLTGNRSSIVWTETKENAQAINALSDAEYLQILRPRFGDFLGDISLSGDRFTYPLGLNMSYELTRDRVALVGDAARGVHPIAGQGLNAGLKDIATLSQVLTETARLGQDLGSAIALEEYARWRRFDNMALAAATDGFNRLFSNNSSILRGLRDLGMGIVNASPGLRRRFMKEAAGLSGDIPKLLQGQPI